MKYLNFEDDKYEKGYEPFNLTPENIKNNIGKSIVYVTTRDVDSKRGFVSPKYGIIHSKRYSTLYLNDMDREVDIRSVLECGIKIEKNE